MLPSIVILFLLGGTTITNSAKAIIPSLFIKGSVKYRMTRISILSLIWLITIGLLEYKYNIFDIVNLTVSNYANPNKYLWKANIFHQVVDFFFGSPIFFLEVYLNTTLAIIPCKEGMIDIDIYQFWWQYLFLIILFGSITFSIITLLR